MMIVLALTQMLGVGTTTLMSQRRTKGSVARRSGVQSILVMSILIAFGLGVVGFILRPAYVTG